MQNRKLEEIPEGLVILKQVTFTKYSYVVYFRELLKFLDRKSYCFMCQNNPADTELIGIMLKKRYKTVQVFLKEARRKHYITACYLADRPIYFANPYILRFRQDRPPKAVKLMFKKGENNVS